MSDSHNSLPAPSCRPKGSRRAQERGHPGDASLGEDTNAVSVLVRDDGTDDQFELSVEPVDALDTFEHPYAYAAWRGVDYRLADRRDAA